jgi:hypothetical protein
MHAIRLHCFLVLPSRTRGSADALAESKNEGLGDENQLNPCLEELPEVYSDSYDWSSINLTTVVTLALIFNRTGSCRLGSFFFW